MWIHGKVDHSIPTRDSIQTNLSIGRRSNEILMLIRPITLPTGAGRTRHWDRKVQLLPQHHKAVTAEPVSKTSLLLRMGSPITGLINTKVTITIPLITARLAIPTTEDQESRSQQGLGMGSIKGMTPTNMTNGGADVLLLPKSTSDILRDLTRARGIIAARMGVTRMTIAEIDHRRLRQNGDLESTTTNVETTTLPPQ